MMLEFAVIAGQVLLVALVCSVMVAAVVGVINAYYWLERRINPVIAAGGLITLCWLLLSAFIYFMGKS